MYLRNPRCPGLFLKAENKNHRNLGMCDERKSLLAGWLLRVPPTPLGARFVQLNFMRVGQS
jgi:hypothetical protein